MLAFSIVYSKEHSRHTTGFTESNYAWKHSNFDVTPWTINYKRVESSAWNKLYNMHDQSLLKVLAQGQKKNSNCFQFQLFQSNILKMSMLIM